jgi:HlyD family secretion protein
MQRSRTRWALTLLVAGAAAILLFVARQPGLRPVEPADEPVPPPGGVSAPPTGRLARVAALGRLEPGEGVIRVAGPPRPAVVIEQLLVEEGDRVEEGQPIATLAGIGVQQADVARLRAELANAERELQRNRSLRRGSVLSESSFRALELARDVAAARLRGAEAELELSTVRSPITGQVLAVHARRGERVGIDGIAEIGDTAKMYAVAEVYETDIGRVHPGQQARVRSAALDRELPGVVERVGLEIGKQDTLSTDPVAAVDARVVEVRVRLLEPQAAAALTNARVDVVIEP